jgi:alanine dehydrogenase
MEIMKTGDQVTVIATGQTGTITDVHNTTHSGLIYRIAGSLVWYKANQLSKV